MSYIIKMALDIKARFEPPAPITSPPGGILRHRHHCKSHETGYACQEGHAL